MKGKARQAPDGSTFRPTGDFYGFGLVRFAYSLSALNFLSQLPIIGLPLHPNPNMALSADVFSVLDDLSSRLAGESVLAQTGRDDGLIPSSAS